MSALLEAALDPINRAPPSVADILGKMAPENATAWLRCGERMLDGMPFPVAAYLFHREIGTGQQEAQDAVAVAITGTALAPSWAQAGTIARQARVAANLRLQKQEMARARRKRSRQVDKVMRRLARRWPAVFTDPVPLAIGVTGQIRAGMGKGVTTTSIKRAVHRWVTSVGYLSALAGGEERRNLDGSPAGAPSQEHRQRAQQQLGTMYAQVTP